MWTQSDLRRVLAHGRIEWRRHALERMLEREIGRAEVLSALAKGAIVAGYPGDRPFPSALVGKDSDPPLHVVVALDLAAAVCYVVTVYRPDDRHFEIDWKTRKRP